MYFGPQSMINMLGLLGTLLKPKLGFPNNLLSGPTIQAYGAGSSAYMGMLSRRIKSFEHPRRIR